MITRPGDGKSGLSDRIYMPRRQSPLTGSRKVLSRDIDLNRGTLAFSISGATSQESARDKLIYSLFVALQSPCMCSRMNWRMCLIVLLTVPGPLKAAAGQTAYKPSEYVYYQTRI